MAAPANLANPRNEFFREPLHVIQAERAALGSRAQWMLTTEAREYREPLAIEKARQENPEQGREWLASQANDEATADLLDDDVGEAAA